MTILSRRFPAGLALAGLAAAGIVAAGPAFASEGCTAPVAQWQPREALQQKLTAEGWEVRRIKTDDGCYEVYAIDAEGRRVEAYFDPQTLARVGREGEDRDDRD